MRAVAYARYSTENQDSNSIAYQIDAIQKFCSANDHMLVNIYADEAKSGFNTDRDNFQRMIVDAKSRLFDVIVFYDLSRISRNVVDWFVARDQFRTLNIKLLSCTETIGEADDPASFLSESMKAIISQHFVMETRKKVIAGQAQKAKDGVFLGGIPALGYNIENGKYVINTYEAKAVRLIFQLYSEGYGYKYICNELKKQGFKSKRGAYIGANAILPILKNERYIGVYFWNKVKTKYFGKWAGGDLNPDVVRIEGGCPVIIEKELWERVVKRMSSKTRTRREDSTKYEYLLSGLIRCSECGASYSGNTKTNSRGYVNRYYTCTGKLNKKGCSSTAYNADELEELIYVLMKKEFFVSGLIERTADLILEKVNSAAGTKNKKIGDIKKEISDLDFKISNVLNAIAQGILTPSVQDHLLKLEREKSLLEQSLRNLELTKDKGIDRNTLIKRLKADSDALINQPEKVKNILQKYISRIVISPEYIEISSFADVVSMENSGRGT